jgi:hypothetical protein
MIVMKMQAKVYRKKISSIIQTFLRWWENVPRLLTASVVLAHRHALANWKLIVGTPFTPA